MPLDWRSLQGLPEASAYGSHTDNGFRDTYFCASPWPIRSRPVLNRYPQSGLHEFLARD